MPIIDGVNVGDGITPLSLILLSEP